MAVRSRKDALTYHKDIKKNHRTGHCIFCSIDESRDDFITSTKSFKIIRNIYPYTFWDMQSVEDHIMVVPKKHTESLNDLSATEAVEYIDLIGSYESRGYNIWARAPQSSIKSVLHQHTHLIKPGNRTHKIIMFLRKPYLRFIR